MKKSIEQLKAEQVVATLLKEYTPKEMADKARHYADNFRYAIAQRVTVAIMLATMWDMWEDFDEESIKHTYAEYMKYHDSFNAGNERIFELMQSVNDLLGGELLQGKIADAVNVCANLEEQGLDVTKTSEP